MTLTVYNIRQCDKPNQPITIERTKIDTLVLRDTITKTDIIPKYITKTKTIRDSLKIVKTDSIYVEVEIPIEQKVYQDSSYRAVISGYKASLDTISVFPKQTVITRQITQIKKPKIVISPSVGVGYGFINKKADVFVGVTVGVPIYFK